MKRKELAREFARSEHLPAAAAQDQVDELMHKMIRSLRSGDAVKLPGVGELVTAPLRDSAIAKGIRSKA